MTEQPAPAAAHRVLIITPERESVLLLNEVATQAKAGLRFDHCRDCSEVSVYWRTMRRLPDLIIWSVEAGAGAVRKFSDMLEEDLLRRPIPLLIWALCFSQRDWDGFLRMGAWDCMVKPCDLAEHQTCLDLIHRALASPEKHRCTSSLGIFHSIRM